MIFNNAEQLINKIEQSINRRIENIAFAQDAVLMEMANWIKDNHETLGGWKNVTHNLENSIDYEPSIWEGGKLTGSLEPKEVPLEAGQTAPMEYAAAVEFKPGHWVLSGAIIEYKDKILSMIADFINAI